MEVKLPNRLERGKPGSVRILNRIATVTDQGLEYEADQFLFFIRPSVLQIIPAHVRERTRVALYNGLETKRYLDCQPRSGRSHCPPRAQPTAPPGRPEDFGPVELQPPGENGAAQMGLHRRGVEEGPGPPIQRNLQTLDI